MKKAIQFGAGNVGRGFLADLFTTSGYQVVFIEVNEKLVEELKRRGGYEIEFAKFPSERKIINNVTAVNAKNMEEVVENCWDGDIFATSVGKNNLPAVSLHIASIIKRRKRKGLNNCFNLIIAENVAQGSKLLKELIYRNLDLEEQNFSEKFLGLVEAVIARMVPFMEPDIQKNDPLFIRVEEYSLLPVDKKGFKGELPEIKGFVFAEDIEALEARKLYMHNLGHAIFSYLGYLKGCTFIYEAVADPWIRKKADSIWEKCENGLVKEYGFHRLSLREHREDLVRRFGNQELKDTVVRVSRDPIRKLSPGERLVGGARFIEKHGYELGEISWGIAGALLYNYPEDKEAVKLQKLIKEKGIDEALYEICKISSEERLAVLVKDRWKKLQKKEFA